PVRGSALRLPGGGGGAASESLPRLTRPKGDVPRRHERAARGPLLDLGGDGRADLHRAADRAKPVMRSLDGVRQDGPGGVAGLPGWKRDLEGDLDIGQPVTTAVADLLRADPDVEAVRLGPARGQDVNVDRGAPADGGPQQLGRGEFCTAAAAERELAAA